MDYDLTALPDQYDKTRSMAPERVELWLDTVERHVAGNRPNSILDLGCGTGRFSAALARRFAAHVMGIDPSSRMLARASEKLGAEVVLVRGEAESIPLPPCSVDLVFASMIYHHLKSPILALKECRRVLRPRGVLFIRNGTSDLAGSCPFAPFFPGMVELLRVRLPSRQDIVSAAELAGFRLVSHETVVQRLADTYEEFGSKLSQGGDSVLAELSPDRLAAGLHALGKHAQRVDPKPVEEPIHVFTFDNAETTIAA